MKKILFGLTALFLISQLMVSCSSENEVLSQFSKRKYLKNFKDKNVKYKDSINKYNNELDNIVAIDEYVSTNEENYKLDEIKVNDDAMMVKLTQEKKDRVEKIKESMTNYSEWNKYNRNMDFSKMNFNNSEYSNHIAVLNNNSRSNDVLVAIFCVLIPFVGILIYEGNVTGNFWVGLLLTLIFWIPGIIFAFLVCFGDVSV